MDLSYDAGVDPVELVDIRLPTSGLVSIPYAYFEWLEAAALVDEFDQWWDSRRRDQVHGDALTPFAERHFAPISVQECLKRVL